MPACPCGSRTRLRRPLRNRDRAELEAAARGAGPMVAAFAVRTSRAEATLFPRGCT